MGPSIKILGFDFRRSRRLIDQLPFRATWWELDPESQSGKDLLHLRNRRYLRLRCTADRCQVLDGRPLTSTVREHATAQEALACWLWYVDLPAGPEADRIKADTGFPWGEPCQVGQLTYWKVDSLYFPWLSIGRPVTRTGGHYHFTGTPYSYMKWPTLAEAVAGGLQKELDWHDQGHATTVAHQLCQALLGYRRRMQRRSLLVGTLNKAMVQDEGAR